MDAASKPTTFFHRILAVYIRSRSGQLLHCVGPQQDAVESRWVGLENQLRDIPLRKTVQVRVEGGRELDSATGELAVFEEPQGSQGENIGVVFRFDETPEMSCEIDEFLCSLVLKSISIKSDPRYTARPTDDRVEEIAQAIVDHFDRALRYTSQDDEWNSRGRGYFLDRVRYFVARDQRLEFCLPAFPCKSSNLDKVQGVQPDRGEYIALTNLSRFIQGIEELYPPGAKLWIISDGSVFSDCIGVDDAVVDTYGAELIQMNDRISSLYRGEDRIGFQSLSDLFAVDGSTGSITWDTLERLIPALGHHIPTEMTRESELCRRILMTGFQTDGDELRRRIDAKEASVLALYRGFAKFMLQDLDQNVYTRSMSRSRRRKLSSAVAFEMIQRNQAYSNLVEILFPHHVRLSIHAHPNSGPKFGIQMFGSGVRTTNRLSADGALMQSSDLLHIPTPWHNCVVEIEGHAHLYVTKSEVVRSALSSGELSGGPAGAFEQEGRYFRLSAPPVDHLERDGLSSRGTMEEETTKSERPCSTETVGSPSSISQGVSKDTAQPNAGPRTPRGFRRLLRRLFGCIL